ncbi:uncharacterized protein LOC115622964 isoform X2 [Scaptodrosophila lebanonensis]|nr:uncharacterized protein LOC115622964 isoform X2 [Scaptodrosophila lebanonensis]
MASPSQRQSNGLDFELLCETFAEICPDFNSVSSTGKLWSLGFAGKVLFELGPKMRQIKQSGEHQMWRMLFEDNMSVYIYTDVFPHQINVQPRQHDHKLYLTLNQASLLAVSALCRMLPLQQNPIRLTPMASAIFSQQSIPRIASDLSTLLGHNVEFGQVFKAVISSCQVDGFHLADSECHIAIVAVDTTAKDAVQRQKLRDKTLRLYEQRGKTFDQSQYDVYAKHSYMAVNQIMKHIQSTIIATLPSSKSDD